MFQYASLVGIATKKGFDYGIPHKNATVEKTVNARTGPEKLNLFEAFKNIKAKNRSFSMRCNFCLPELAKKINALSPASVKMIKQNLQFSLEETYAKSMEKEVKCQRILGHSDNYKEGLNAFFEKREAQFSRD